MYRIFWVYKKPGDVPYSPVPDLRCTPMYPWHPYPPHPNIRTVSPAKLAHPSLLLTTHLVLLIFDFIFH